MLKFMITLSAYDTPIIGEGIKWIVNIIVKAFYGLYFGLIKAIAWVLDMLTQLFFIFAGMTPIGTNSTANADDGIDIVNFFLTQKSFQKAYLYLCLVALGLIIVFAIGKILKQDYFDRSGPRSKAPIFRNIALSFIAFICIIPVFYFMIDAVSALALLVMKALGYKGGGLGSMLFNMSWDDGGESIRTLAIKLRNPTYGELSLTFKDFLGNVGDQSFNFFVDENVNPSKVYDPDNFGWYSSDTFYAYYWNASSGVKNASVPGTFYWWVFLLTGPILIVNLGQMMLAMVTRLFKLVSLFVVAPSPISQIVLDDGHKFKAWKDQVVQEALKVVGCVMSFMIFMMMASFVPEIDLMKFAYTEDAASASLLESGNMTTELSNSISALYYYGDTASWVDRAINALGRCMLLIAGVGAIKDIDQTITPLISGGKSSMDMGATGGAIASAGKALGSGALELTKKGVGLAAAGASAMVGLAAGGVGALANGAASGVRSLAATLGAGKGNGSNNGNSTGDGNSSDGGDGGGGITPPIGGNNTPPTGGTDEEGANPGVETPTTETPDVPEPNSSNGGGESGGTGEAGAQTPDTQTPDVSEPNSSNGGGESGGTGEAGAQAPDTQAPDVPEPNSNNGDSESDETTGNGNNESKKIGKIRDKADKKVQNIRNKADKKAQNAMNDLARFRKNVNAKNNAKNVALGVLSGVREGLVSTVKGVGGSVLKTGKTLVGTAAKSGLSMAGIMAKTTASMVGWGGVYNSVESTAKGIGSEFLGKAKEADGYIAGAGKEMMSAGKDIADSMMYKRDANGNFVDENGDSINKDGYKVNSYGHLVDEAGKSINKDGYRIDDKGEMIKDSAGNYVKGGEPIKGGKRAQTGLANTIDSVKEWADYNVKLGKQNFREYKSGDNIGSKFLRTASTAGKIAGATIFKGTEGYMDAVRSIDENAQYDEEAKINKVNKIYERAEKAEAKANSKADDKINKAKIREEEAKIRTEKFNVAKENMAQTFQTAKQNITEGFNTVKDGVSGTFEKVGQGVHDKIQHMKANAEERKQRRIAEDNQRVEQPQVARKGNFTIQNHYISDGQNDISSGMNIMSSSSVGDAGVVQGAEKVSAGADAIVNEAQQVYASQGSPAGSHLESRVDAANLARAASSVIENNDIAQSYANGVKEYVAMNSDEPERIQRFTNMATEFNGSKNSNVVTQVAEIKGIQALNAQMKTDYNKAMSNVNLSESEKNRIHFEYAQKGQQLDNAYRYVNGDTTVGKESYDNVIDQIKGTKEYTNALNKKKGNYDSKSLKAADEKYQKDMIERASAGETRAREQKDSFEKTINSKMGEMSARDKVTYHKTRFECEKDRYDKASKHNDLSKMDIAHAAMKSCGKDLSDSAFNLRQKMAEEITKGAQQNVVNEQQTTQEPKGKFKKEEIDVSIGQQDIAVGMNKIENAGADAFEVVEGSDIVSSSADEVVDMADSIHLYQGSPADSQLERRVDSAQLAEKENVARVNSRNATMHLEGVKKFCAANGERTEDYYKNFKDDFIKNKHNAVSRYASMEGIYQITENMKKDYEAAMANDSLSNEEKMKRQQEYYNNRQKYDNAYRYLSGDTSVVEDIYDRTVEENIQKQVMYNNIAECANNEYYDNTKRKKYLGEHKFNPETMMDKDKKYQKEMLDIANDREKLASEQFRTTQNEANNAMRDMSALDRVEYHQKKFDYERQRYQEAYKDNDKVRMDSAQSDMKIFGDELRSSIADLRKFMTEAVKGNKN